MKIQAIISHSYVNASILEDTRDVWHYLRECDSLAVVDEELKTVGIVTSKDLITHPESRNLVDCDFSKPKISPASDIFDVIKIMNDGNFDCLPVFENENFLGVVKLIDITNQLASTVKKQKLEYHKVVHDLRNPIMNISGLLKIIEEPHETDQQVITLCESSCKHALNILDDLIYLAGEEHRPSIKEPIELNQFYQSCVEEQKGLFLKKGIMAETEFDDRPYLKTIDQKQLKRAIENILSNAIKFSYPNSIVKISTKLENDRLTLKVLDAGIGIPEQIQGDIFNDFTVARRPGTVGEPSTGLGLSLTKRCIEAHGGEIYFKSAKGKGSKFYIVL